jgi:hypothetical protein
MEKTTIRKEVLEWFKSKLHIETFDIFTSKFYTPQEI